LLLHEGVNRYQAEHEHEHEDLLEMAEHERHGALPRTGTGDGTSGRGWSDWGATPKWEAGGECAIGSAPSPPLPWSFVTRRRLRGVLARVRPLLRHRGVREVAHVAGGELHDLRARDARPNVGVLCDHRLERRPVRGRRDEHAAVRGVPSAPRAEDPAGAVAAA